MPEPAFSSGDIPSPFSKLMKTGSLSRRPFLDTKEKLFIVI
jgi:hypothetical protein